MSAPEHPFLGAPREEQDAWVCGHLPVRQSTKYCDLPAEYHGLIFEDDQASFKAMMWCCDKHLPKMELSAQLVHDLGSACGLPGSVVEWDRGVSWCHLPSSEALAIECAEWATQ